MTAPPERGKPAAGGFAPRREIHYKHPPMFERPEHKSRRGLRACAGRARAGSAGR
jgi:hypothetical protein